MSTTKEENTKEVIATLAQQFYGLGWFPGSGGSLTIRENPDRIFIAPSGVQKERIKAEDIFILNAKAQVVERPPLDHLRPSQCTPLFMVAYNGNNYFVVLLFYLWPHHDFYECYFFPFNAERPEVKAVIHSHDPNVVLASMLYKGNEFKIKNQHMIKVSFFNPLFLPSCLVIQITFEYHVAFFKKQGIFNNVEGRPGFFDEELVVPIVENAREDYMLCDSVAQAIRDYPQANAVILRHHGIHIWGRSWQQCKLMAESYHYLLAMAVEMHKCGINPYTIE